MRSRACSSPREGEEAHAVRMERQALAAVQHEVVVRERHRVLAEQLDPARGLGLDHLLRRGGDVDGLGTLAEQAEDHRAVAAVPVPGGAQRAEQLDPHPGDRPSRPSSSRPWANVRAARIGPTVCDEDGPMPIENRSNTEIATHPSCALLARSWRSVGSAHVNAPLVRRSPAHSAVVVAAAQLTARMRRVTVQCDAMRGVQVKPAQDVELLLREANRAARKAPLHHPVRPAGDRRAGSRRAAARRRTRLGLGCERAARRHGRVPGPARQARAAQRAVHLLVGDESAIPAIAAICAALPESERSVAVVEVRDADDELDIDAETHWVPRGATAPGGAELLTAALGDLDDPARRRRLSDGRDARDGRAARSARGPRRRPRRDLRQGLLEPRPAGPLRPRP